MEVVTKSKLLKITLPNGKKISCIRKAEALSMFETVPAYLEHGVKLKPKDIIFDVGSNIGMVPLLLNWQFNNELNIYCFEPVVEIFNALSSNAKSHFTETTKIFNFGISNETKILTISYYPRTPSMSSIYPDESEEERVKLRDTILRNLQVAPKICKRLLWMPSLFRKSILDNEFKKSLVPIHSNSQFKTLSKVIKDEKIEKIDWLKIDVEKAEMDVLLGIDNDDWPKIKQISIEVHDINNRLHDITEKLMSKGMKVLIGQEPLFQGSDVHYIHAYY